MYKLYGKDGSEKTVETNTDRKEHIKSGFYSDKVASKAKSVGIDVSSFPDSDAKTKEKKNYSKPKRKGI